MMRESIHQEYTAILNLHQTTELQNTHTHKWIDLKGKINKYSVLIRDFNNSPSQVDKPPKQHTSNNTDLNNIINQPGLIDIYKTFHPTTAVYKLVFKVHETFTNMEVP